MRSDDVKYMLLIYSNPANAEAMSEEERSQVLGEVDTLIMEVRPILRSARDGAVSADTHIEDLLRELAPQVLGALVRRYRHFDACEEAVADRRRYGSPARSGGCCRAMVRWPGCWGSCCSPTRGARPAPGPTAPWCRSPNRTGGGGIRKPPRKGLR